MTAGVLTLYNHVAERIGDGRVFDRTARLAIKEK